MKLINDWRESWKFWSIRLGLIGTALTSIFLAAPEAALYAWAALPSDLKSLINPEVIKFIGVAILVLSFIARVIRQTKLEAENERNANQADKISD